MSQAEELLNSLSTSSQIADTIVEGHIVIDENRVVHVPNELKRIAVQNDHNIETVTFDCPRYWDGIDMSEMVIYINYKLPDETKGRYIATNIRIDENDSNLMHFDWTIMNYMTVNKGTITFLVCIVDPEEVGLPKDVTFNTVIYAKDKFIAAGDNVVYYSEDGIIWNEGMISGFSSELNITTMACDGENIVGIGNAIYYSSIDTIEFEEMDGPDGGIRPKDVTYGNGKFIIVGGSKICYSVDGITWYSANLPENTTTTFNSVTYGNDKFVAVGNGGCAYYSTDGIIWTIHNIEETVITDSDNLLSVIYANGYFSATSVGKIFISIDGITWNDAYSLKSYSDKPRFIAYNNGIIAIIIENTLYIYNLDISKYVFECIETIDFENPINSLTYHDGKYIAVGRNLDMYYSLNGTDWGLPEAPISRHWNSELNKEMYVSEGMECEDGTVISPSSDIVAQLVARMDSVFRNVSNGKQSLASAIADKGISIDADATFEEIANQLTNEMYKVTTMNAVHTSHIELSESEVQVIE